MDVYINNLSTRKSFKSYNDISNKQQIVQWCCCDCAQSYGTIVYNDQVIQLLHQEDELSQLKYYSSIIYNSNGDGNSNYPVLKSLTPPFQKESTDDYFVSKDTTANSSRNSSDFRARKDSVDTEESNISLGNDSTSTVTTAPSGGNSIDGDENPKPFNELNDNDMSQYLIMTPERFVCSRCSHMMCPYCPKLRCKDLS